MKKAFILPTAFILLCLLVSFPVSSEARPLSSLNVSVLSPVTCPAGGCAAGQRLNVRAEYSVNPLYTTGQNTQVCIYTSVEGSNTWADGSVLNITNTSTYTNGELTSICSANLPASGVYLGGANAKFDAISTQQFDFAFRINKLSTGAGSLQISIYQLNATGDTWTITDGPNPLNLTVTPAADPSYVTQSSAACTINPCYLNSGDDLANGIGTGLKDAVDASPLTGTIHILGTYSIKSNTVTLNNAQTIQGDGDATLSYTGSSCGDAMLSVTGGATIQNLNINDGSCTSPSRNLISINSPVAVYVTSNDLVNGKDAISIQENTGDISVRFNQIFGNSGYGIHRTDGSGAGTVNAVANNIYNNRTGAQVECNNKGKADHNFWGKGVIESSAISQCTYTGGKRLGAAILANGGQPGVNAQSVTLSETDFVYPSSQISLKGTDNTIIILVDHGNGSADNIPFLGSGTENIIACSDFWDMFISDDNPVTTTFIDFYLKYNLNSRCVSSIESIAFCGGLNPDISSIPLLWYDPKNSITDKWDTTGQIPAGSGASGMVGQTTTCDTTNKEIKVSIDNNLIHRPNLVSDLNYTPFVIGYPFIFNQFSATSGIGVVELNWETSAENNIKGYYVVRALTQYGTYYRASSMIPSLGDSTIGGIYNFTDSGLNNGTTYWYKLELIDNNNYSIGFNTPISATTYSMVPMLSQVSPTSTLLNTALSITITGNNFVLGSWVCWNGLGDTCSGGTRLNTSYTDINKLNAVVPSTLLNYAGTFTISVINPNPGGGASTSLNFIVNNPVATLDSISPTTAFGLGSQFELTVTGSNFIYLPSETSKKSKIYWNGSGTDIEMTSWTSTVLKANIPASKLKTYGSINITVFNPGPGGGLSNALPVTVYTPVPTATKIPTVYRSPVPPYRSPTPQRTRTRTPTITTTGTRFITPSATLQFTPNLTQSATPDLTTPTQTQEEPVTTTPTLAPGEPTYTPEAPSPGEETGLPAIWKWRLLSALRVFGGILLGIGLLSIPSFFIFRNKTRNTRFK